MKSLENYQLTPDITSGVYSALDAEPVQVGDDKTPKPTPPTREDEVSTSDFLTEPVPPGEVVVALANLTGYTADLSSIVADPRFEVKDFQQFGNRVMVMAINTSEEEVPFTAVFSYGPTSTTLSTPLALESQPLVKG